jgi:uncharacterized phage protein (TIGR01671 family)
MNKREIKFRVWDKINNCFFDWKEQYNTLEFNEGIPDRIILYDTEGVLEKDEFELMQYTGLKDVNGVEIYEGDIILYPDTESEFIDVGIGGEGVKVAETGINSFFPVEFKDGEFGINVNLNSEILYNGWYTLRMALEEVESIEVIGNIYENPELLTNKN